MALLTAVVLCLPFLTKLLRPKRNDYGATWPSYRAAETDSMDVLFVGTSLVYCDVDPTALEKASGLAAWDVSGPVLTAGQSYWYVRQALRTQSPKVLMVEVTNAFIQEKNDYTRICVDNMPFGAEKLGCILSSSALALRRELLFPLLRHHDNWQDLTREDWQETIGPPVTNDVRGHTFLYDVWAPDTEEKTIWPPYMGEYEANLAAYAAIQAYCAERNITVGFYYSPRWEIYEPEALQRLEDDLETYCPGALYVDFNDYTEQMDLSWTDDLYDDLHLNAYGAEKFSVYLGQWLKENYEF